ncbi:hypothetical protein [Nocardia pneumoniae]|uniref:hypothetical protein n=1 Tax=Nocardia pneumoniae TaxID=228601 RepID=UPI0002E5CF05
MLAALAARVDRIHRPLWFATAVPGVYAAGDAAYVRSVGRRSPFWSNAVAQGKVAAASALGLEPRATPIDDYFWTEILGVPIKVSGPLPF